ncbi:protein CrcB [Micromonospora pisi]|uniref:Fluoride-specific ion channel FluC n=1 Tax=Micromonospora pisi TaxID=589240 RepID=A0A495JK71_9ACTN|nr:fluoride efflux transporter CrcB [Micromonospora pisi]RKR89313.1 protein CrcB [Micromonospora pisi]
MTRKGIAPHGGPTAGTLPDRLPWDVVAAVALGGALGSAARYGVSVAWPTPSGQLPWATLVINLTGCALLGMLMAFVTARIAPHRLLRPFLGTGVLGGYTTFSTYAVETRGLLDTGRPLLAAGYVFGTLAGALIAVWLGGWLVARIGPKP